MIEGLEIEETAGQTDISYEGSKWSFLGQFGQIGQSLMNKISDFLSGGRNQPIRDREVKPKDIKNKYNE